MGDILDPSVLWKNNPSATTSEQAKSPITIIEDLIKIIKFQVKEVNEYLESFKNPDQSDDAKNLLELLRVLEKLLQNLEFSEGIIKCTSEEEIKSVKEKFSSLKGDYDQLKSKEDLNLIILSFTLEFLRNVLLEEFVIRMDDCFKRDKESKYCFQKSWINSAWIQIMTFRLEAVVENYHKAVCYSKSDLFSSPKDSQVWQDLYKVTTFKEVLPEEELEAVNKSIFALIFIVFSIVKERCDKSPNPDFSGTLGLLRDVIRFKRDPAQSEAFAWYYLRDPSVTCFRLSLIQNPLMKTIRNFKLPSIGDNQIIYLPRVFPQITKELILQEYQNKTINRLSLHEDQIICSKESDQKLEDLFVPDSNKIQVRIVSPQSLNLQKKGIFSSFRKTNTTKIDSKAIVIHVHGGGWARGESELYLNNLIPWAKTLNLVIFSVDYRLAPQNPYPCGLDDVWQSYLWILHYSQNILGIKFEKIILVGDSAGGNLISALTLRLIKTGLRVPDGLFMIYPSFDLKVDMSRPSLLRSLNNAILPLALMKLFVNSYVGEFKLSEDPFISPMVACDELLEKFPPSRIVVGTADPIEDDTWRFMSRLIKFNRNVKAIVYKGLLHGYYSAGATKFTNEVTKDGSDIIHELINL